MNFIKITLLSAVITLLGMRSNAQIVNCNAFFCRGTT